MPRPTPLTPLPAAVLPLMLLQAPVPLDVRLLRAAGKRPAPSRSRCSWRRCSRVRCSRFTRRRLQLLPPPPLPRSPSPYSAHPLPPPHIPPRCSRCSAIPYLSLHCRSRPRCSAIHCLLPHCRSPRHFFHPHRLPPLRRLSQSRLPLLLPRCSPPPPSRLPSGATPPHPRHLHLRPRHRPHHRHLLTVTLACCRASGWQPPPSRSSHRGRPCRRLTPTVGASPEPFIPHRATAVHGHRAMCHTRRHTGGTMSASSHGSTGAASTTATHCLRAQQRCSTASATP